MPEAELYNMLWVICFILMFTNLLRDQLNKFAYLLQSALFPAIEPEVGELSETSQTLVSILAMLPLQRFVPVAQGWNGRPAKHRLAIARSFVAKAVYNFPTTRDLIDRLQCDSQLRRICGWDGSPKQIPHESSFSRAFHEFAEMEFPQFVHAALIHDTQKDRLIGHICRDSTQIEARERFPQAARRSKKEERKARRLKAKAKQAQRAQKAKQSNAGANGTSAGCPAKDKPAPKDETRIERQRKMSLPEMLNLSYAQQQRPVR